MFKNSGGASSSSASSSKASLSRTMRSTRAQETDMDPPSFSSHVYDTNLPNSSSCSVMLAQIHFATPHSNPLDAQLYSQKQWKINRLHDALFADEHIFQYFLREDLYEMHQRNSAGNLFKFLVLPHRIVYPDTGQCRLKLGTLGVIEIPSKNRPKETPNPLGLFIRNEEHEAVRDFSKNLATTPMDLKQLGLRFHRAFACAPDLAMEGVHKWMTTLSKQLKLAEPAYPIVVTMNDETTSMPLQTILITSQTRLAKITTAAAGSHMVGLLLKYICMHHYFQNTQMAAIFKQKIMGLKSIESALATTHKAYFEHLQKNMPAQALPPHELSLLLQRDFVISILVIELTGTDNERAKLVAQLAALKTLCHGSTTITATRVTTTEESRQIIANAISEVIQYFNPVYTVSTMTATSSIFARMRN